MLQAIIFVTGGAILALELLASRILTPYFGVSLYIWSGILSITLVSLAAGYWWGGRLAAGTRNHAPTPEKLAYLFTRMPAVAAIAIVAACLVYPYLFHRLAQFDLVVGAFIACIVLLFVPLFVTSAMNPLLVAIFLRQSATRGDLADAGAGRVFFVSTIGSVAGVVVSAFGLIPYMSNFAAALVVAVVLAVLPLILLFGSSIKVAQRKRVTVKSAIALALALGLLLASGAYTARMWPASYNGANWSLESVYRSSFGTVKVLKSGPRDNEPFTRMYFQDGLVQNVVGATNRSLSMYTYALEALSFSYKPQMRTALVLGIGAGMLIGGSVMALALGMLLVLVPSFVQSLVREMPGASRAAILRPVGVVVALVASSAGLELLPSQWETASLIDLSVSVTGRPAPDGWIHDELRKRPDADAQLDARLLPTTRLSDIFRLLRLHEELTPAEHHSVVCARVIAQTPEELRAPVQAACAAP